MIGIDYYDYLLVLLTIYLLASRDPLAVDAFVPLACTPLQLLHFLFAYLIP